jgi:hypothetical protein
MNLVNLTLFCLVTSLLLTAPAWFFSLPCFHNLMCSVQSSIVMCHSVMFQSMICTYMSAVQQDYNSVGQFLLPNNVIGSSVYVSTPCDACTMTKSSNDTLFRLYIKLSTLAASLHLHFSCECANIHVKFTK